MDDQRIIELYFDRDESAIAETQKKYGAYCHTVAAAILSDARDTEECVNDTYLHAWNAIPPTRPSILSAFLAAITRNLALMRYRANHRERRGGGTAALALEELENCIPAPSGGSITDDIHLRDSLNAFLRSLPDASRDIFLRRYWFVRTVPQIAAETGMKESRVKMILHRTRERLREHLIRDGIEL
jgi:RNA polymerase sigma-70 factor (ECF subfamily)